MCLESVSNADRDHAYLFSSTQAFENLSAANHATVLRSMAHKELDGKTDPRVTRNYFPLREAWARVRDAFGLQALSA